MPGRIAAHAAQTAERRVEPAGAFGADALNGLERAFAHALAALGVHPREGEAVHLLLNLVHEHENILPLGQPDVVLAVGERAGFMMLVLDHAEHRQRDALLLQQRADHADVRAAAVEQDQVGRAPVGQVRDAALHRLAHGGVVVLHIAFFDVEQLVFPLGEFPVQQRDHPAGDMLVAAVGDVVGFDALGQHLQMKQLGQRGELAGGTGVRRSLMQD